MASPRDEFHRLYYDSEVWLNTTWRGVHTLKCPLDLWLYQEIIVHTRPDLIIECGTFNGGSALFLADMCELVGNGSVVTIDVHPQPQLPCHERITYLTGSSIAPEMLATVSPRICGRTMVILDSNHAASHVYAELLLWSTVVTEGCYLIVEDTNRSIPDASRGLRCAGKRLPSGDRAVVVAGLASGNRW